MTAPAPPSLPAGLAGLPPAAANAVIAAERALRTRDAASAERQLTAAMALAPNHPEVLHLAGHLHLLRGRIPDAVRALQQAQAQRPRDPLILNSLGTALRNAGRTDEAGAAFREACALNPNLPAVWFNLALVHAALAEVPEAVAALRRALTLQPDNHNARTLLADLLKEEGSVEDARALYRDVLARQPLSGMAWLGLSNLKTLPLDDADVRALEAALANPRTGEHDRVAMQFALAKALEDQARYADAFAVLQRANALARRRKPAWHRAALRAQVDAALGTPLAQASAPELGRESIFVVSLPRSGSTLTEQILASHPQVDGAGEINDLWLTLGEEAQRRQQHFAQWAPRLQPADWQRLGERYLERTARWRRTRPRFTNKLPGNWQYIAAIRAMLPGAHVVACERDPLETCFACYRQMLDGNEYTHDFADLAAYWRDFDRSVREWQARDPDRVRVQSYEALVADTEAEVRALLAFCGLPFDAACLRFYETDRRTHTPSAAQVRQPIRRDTARAPKYGALLDPLRAALRAAGVDVAPGGAAPA